MAGELGYRHLSTGKTLYVTIRNSLHEYWNTDTEEFEVLVVSNWGDYAVALTESPSGSYLYVGDWPSELVDHDWYIKDLYEQQGVSPDITDKFLANVASYWDGQLLNPTALNLIDGLEVEKVFSAILATAAGKVTVVDNGDGTYTATFKRQDGVTTALSVTYNPATGTRAVTAVVS